MCKELGLSWQCSKTREWFPVARIGQYNGEYSFRYTHGALEAKNIGFQGLAGFSDFEKTYLSDTIFPVFQNRIMNKSRPDRDEFLSWIELDNETYSPFEELARTGGIKATDNLQLYPIPSEVAGKYKVQFFSHGISHLPDNYKDRTNCLSHKDKLYLCADLQNEQDVNALFLRTSDPVELVGYAPKFFAKDFLELFNKSKDSFEIVVVKVNKDAPESLRLLCEISCDWPKGFTSFKDKPFQTFL
jgi:hypothetical protein